MNNHLLKKFSGYLFLLPYLILFFTFLLLPLFYGLVMSFFQWEMLTPLPPVFVGFGNFKEALSSDYFWKAMGATLRFVGMSVPLGVLLSLLIALGINACSEKRQGFYRACYFLPTMISIAVAGILWRWFFSTEFGLFNAYLSYLGHKIPWLTDEAWAMKSVVLMSLWWTVGGGMVILIAGLKHIPNNYYEAAAIDGANIPQRFLYITLPLLRPVLLFVIVMSTIGSFQVFGQTFVITEGMPEYSTRVLVQYIYETAFLNYRMGYAASMSWLLFLVIAGFSIIQFRILREQ